MARDTEITKVRIVIRHLLWQIREVRNDKDAAWKWVNRFANTLQYQDLEQDPDQYALDILAEARSFNDQKKRNQQMRWVREQLAKEGVKNPTQEQLDDKWLEMYCNESTADGDTREDSLNVTDGSNAALLESGASANHYGPRQPEARQSQRAGGNSLRVANVSTSPARSAGPMPADKQAVMDFASLEGLDVDDAYECWHVTVNERDGLTADGKPVKNWKAYVRKWCETRAKRRTA